MPDRYIQRSHLSFVFVWEKCVLQLIDIPLGKRIRSPYRDCFFQEGRVSTINKLEKRLLFDPGLGPTECSGLIHYGWNRSTGGIASQQNWSTDRKTVLPSDTKVLPLVVCREEEDSLLKIQTEIQSGLSTRCLS